MYSWKAWGSCDRSPIWYQCWCWFICFWWFVHRFWWRCIWNNTWYLKPIEDYNYGNIEGLVIWVQDGIYSGISWFFAGWLGIVFNRDADGITLGIYEEIDIGFSYRSFEFFNYGNLEGHVKVVQYGINSGVGWCIYDC